MDVATGAIGSLLPKLLELLNGDSNLQSSVRKDVQFLSSKLEPMLAALRRAADVPRNQLDEQVTKWADEVRELSYIMEDELDSFLASVQSPESVARFKGPTKKMGNLLETSKTRHPIAKKIMGRLKVLASDIDKVDSVVATAAATVDPPPSAMYQDPKEIIGIEQARDDLIKRLIDGDNDQLKILSIFGFGGLGKTTLAKAVYELRKAQFDCTAFISVGRKPDMMKIFKNMLDSLPKQNCTSDNEAMSDESNLIDQIQALLENKRYFIVIDDIWDIEAWEIIRCALMDSKNGSRIITTTRILEVAIKAGDVYKLEPLSSDNSEALLRKQLFGKENSSATFAELYRKILQKCGGIPSAIITVASLLASKQEDLPKEYNPFVEDVQIITRTLLLSYYDLPYHLRTCLLYLSIFPENYMIRKDTLIWKWVAEGFVHEEPGIGLFELGERYFFELVNRSMILPVEIPHSGIVVGCRLHVLVFEMILSLTKEEKFVGVLGSDEQHTSSSNNARRVAVQGRDMTQDLAANMESSRSFSATLCHIIMMPPLSSFKALRVLAIEDCTFVEGQSYCLENLASLLQLRYLGLRNTPIQELPKDIGDLDFVQTLDLRQTKIEELPDSVGQLRKLRCLRANGGSIRVPNWIEKLTSLEELTLNDVCESPNFVEDVGKLTQLRELRIWIVLLDERYKKALVKSLGNLHKMQVLFLDGGMWSEADWEDFVPPRQLRNLSLQIKSCTVPRWINAWLVPNLLHLSVDVKVLELQDLETLGKLPELLSLKLFLPKVKVSLDINGGGAFPKLRHFYTSGTLRFLAGAMPSLESVNFSVLLRPGKDADFEIGSLGLGNLPLLKNVRVEILYPGGDHGAEIKQMKAALRDTVNKHPNNPIKLDVSDCESFFDEESSQSV